MPLDLTNLFSVVSIDGSTAYFFVDSSGDITCAGSLVVSDSLEFDTDSTGIKWGADDDASMLHDGSTGVILTVAANDADALEIAASTGTVAFVDTLTGDLSFRVVDGVDLELGAGSDDKLCHDGTNSSWIHTTGDLTIDNQLVTGSTIFLLGTDTSATDFQVQNNSATAILTVKGDSSAILAGGLQITGGALNVDQALDLDHALTGTGELANIAGTINHATQSAEGLDISLVQLSTSRTAGTVSAVKASTTSLAGDAAGQYNSFEAACTDGGGAAVHSALAVGAGFQYSLDLTSLATGTGDIRLAANKADAMSISDSTGDLLVAVTTTGDLSIGVPDNVDFEIGSSGDDSIVHNGTNSIWTHSTGDLTFDNVLVTGSTIFILGTDTNATDFQIQNNSAAAKFTVDGSGQATFAGNVDAANGLDVTTAALTSAAGLTLTVVGLTMTGLDIGSATAEIGSIYLADSKGVYFGADQDDSIVHNGTNSIWTHATGDLIVDNTLVTGSSIFRLGTDTAACDFQVQNNSEAAVFSVTAAGAAAITGGLTLTTAGLTMAGLDIGSATSEIGTIYQADSKGVYFGADQDASLLHDGTKSLNLAVADDAAAAFAIKEAANSYLTIVTSNDSESVAVGKRLTTTDGVASGTVRVVGGRAYSSTAASDPVTNSTVETLFNTTYSMPASTLKAGSRVRIRYQGIATSTNGTDTLTIRCYLGGLAGTALVTTIAVDVANNDTFYGDVEVICRTAGTAGTFVANAFYQDPDVAGTAPKWSYVASTAIDTTAVQVIGVSADWGAAHGDNSARLDMLSVDIA